MSNFAFVSDFDGTLSERDFYHIVIDKYLKDKGKALYAERKKTGKIDVEFLNVIFGSINLSLDQLKDEILQIPLDPAAADFILEVRKNGGEFYIVSAGTSYYINILLEHLGLDVNVISMKGEYLGGGIRITPDERSPYYSNIFGLDKRMVVQNIKKDHEKVFFAGDSEPDLLAAKAADYAFAKGELKEMLLRDGHSFIDYENFSDIWTWMRKEGWL